MIDLQSQSPEAARSVEKPILSLPNHIDISNTNPIQSPTEINNNYYKSPVHNPQIPGRYPQPTDANSNGVPSALSAARIVSEQPLLDYTPDLGDPTGLKNKKQTEHNKRIPYHCYKLIVEKHEASFRKPSYWKNIN